MSDNQDLLWEHGEKISIGFKYKYYRVEKVEEGQPMPHKNHGQPMSQRRTTSNRRRSDPREGDSSSSVSSTFSYPRPPSYPYPYPQPYPYPYPQPYSHPPPYPSHFIQLPVHLGMSTSGQIGELQVCMYLYYNFIIMCSPLI